MIIATLWRYMKNPDVMYDSCMWWGEVILNCFVLPPSLPNDDTVHVLPLSCCVTGCGYKSDGGTRCTGGDNTVRVSSKWTEVCETERKSLVLKIMFHLLDSCREKHSSPRWFLLFLSVSHMNCFRSETKGKEIIKLEMWKSDRPLNSIASSHPNLD